MSSSCVTCLIDYLSAFNSQTTTQVAEALPVKDQSNNFWWQVFWWPRKFRKNLNLKEKAVNVQHNRISEAIFVANLDNHTQYGSPLLQAQTTGVPSRAIPQCETSHLDKAAVVIIEINNKSRDKKNVIRELMQNNNKRPWASSLQITSRGLSEPVGPNIDTIFPSLDPYGGARK